MKKITKSTQNNKHSSSEKKFEITGIIMFLFGAFVCLSLFGYKTGIIGDFLVDGFHVLFGISSPIIALAFTFVVRNILCPGQESKLIVK